MFAQNTSRIILLKNNLWFCFLLILLFAAVLSGYVYVLMWISNKIYQNGGVCTRIKPEGQTSLVNFPPVFLFCIQPNHARSSKKRWKFFNCSTFSFIIFFLHPDCFGVDLLFCMPCVFCLFGIFDGVHAKHEVRKDYVRISAQSEWKSTLKSIFYSHQVYGKSFFKTSFLT